MAGDWIKIEKSTAAKPEVLKISELLGIHPAHAFGLCVRFWVWCDDQMSDGHAIAVTDVTLDAQIGHVGFADALRKVDWLQVRSGSLVVPRFDRHLSESAKNRALSHRRQQNKRAKDDREKCHAKSVTREEKRREEKEGEAIRPPPPPSLAQTKNGTVGELFMEWGLRKGAGRPCKREEIESMFADLLDAGVTKEAILEALARPPKVEWPSEFRKRVLPKKSGPIGESFQQKHARIKAERDKRERDIAHAAAPEEIRAKLKIALQS
jgi:hypothetical protein